GIQEAVFKQSRLNQLDLKPRPPHQGRTSLQSTSGLVLKETIKRLTAEGVELHFTWVRGHNGHALNDCADRAARIARRCKQLGTDNKTQLLANLRVELGKKIVGRTPESWLIPQKLIAS
ncbi:MAG: hypothetical protein ACTIBI_04110, partial [Corynebacterium casei]